MIYQICDAMMSIDSWGSVRFLNLCFEPELIIPPNLVNWLDLNKDIIFLKSSEHFGGLVIISRPFSILQVTPITQ